MFTLLIFSQIIDRYSYQTHVVGRVDDIKNNIKYKCYYSVPYITICCVYFAF